jgi:hypothetical protein
VRFFTGAEMTYILPPQIGLSKDQAAAYLGLSNLKFAELIQKGQLPLPLELAGVQVWSVKLLRRWFNRLEEKWSPAREEARSYYPSERYD